MAGVSEIETAIRGAEEPDLRVRYFARCQREPRAAHHSL